jgi:hypothetical protein
MLNGGIYPLPIILWLIRFHGLKPHGRRSIFFANAMPLLHLWLFLKSSWYGQQYGVLFSARIPSNNLLYWTQASTLNPWASKVPTPFSAHFPVGKVKIHFASQAGFTPKLKKKYNSHCVGNLSWSVGK